MRKVIRPETAQSTSGNILSQNNLLALNQSGFIEVIPERTGGYLRSFSRPKSVNISRVGSNTQSRASAAN